MMDEAPRGGGLNKGRTIQNCISDTSKVRAFVWLQFPNNSIPLEKKKHICHHFDLFPYAAILSAILSPQLIHKLCVTRRPHTICYSQVFSSCEECYLFLSIHKWEAKRRQSVKVEKTPPPSAHKEEQTKTKDCGYKQTGIHWMREIFWMNKNMGVETDRDFSCVLQETKKRGGGLYRQLNVATLISKKEIRARSSHLKHCFFIFSLTNRSKQVSIFSKSDFLQFSDHSAVDDAVSTVSWTQNE